MSAIHRNTLKCNKGVTMVELMVAMLLGLVVVGGATSVIVANRQSYRTNEALAQVQESARTAFELLARDIRQAGSTGCDNTGRVGSVLKASSNWWQNWGGITGFDGATTDPAVTTGTNVAERVAGTHSLQIRGTEGTGLSVETHDPTSANFKINAASPQIQINDVLIVCDFDHATIFQVSNYNSNNVTVVHNTGAGPSPGNCSKGLGFPTDCSSTNGNAYTFGPNSQVARFSAVSWYIGNNGRANEGGRSLYRRRLGSGASLITEEVVAGVQNLQLGYRVDGSTAFVAPSAVAAADWATVNAVQLTLTMTSADARVSTAPGTNNGRIERTFTHLVTLRNRVP